jgi:hypothetical protein
MLVTGLASIDQFLRRNSGARTPMQRWIELAEAAEWNDITEVQDPAKCRCNQGNEFDVLQYRRQQFPVVNAYLV